MHSVCRGRRDLGNDDILLGILEIIRPGITDDIVDMASAFGRNSESLGLGGRDNLAGDHVVNSRLQVLFSELYAFRDQIESIFLEGVTADRGLGVLEIDVVEEADENDGVDPGQDT